MSDSSCLFTHQEIVGVEKHSIAHKLHIRRGDFLISVNECPVKDIFDYRFLIKDTDISLEILRPGKGSTVYEFSKDEDEDLGLEFASPLMDEYKSCRNKCIFCFIDQMPPGMRDTLYFKDDDSRLSFLQGNYVTLTNMKDEDIERIIRYRMEPINISVHTVNPELRCKMLNNRFAGDVLKYLKMLYDANITMNAQIVMCKGINDGRELYKTIETLSGYAPVMQSLSVVPVGLTKYRKGLFPLESIEKSDAGEAIDIIESFQKKIRKKCGINFVHASDELYLLAERPLPEEERYDGFPQLENGVGMVRLLDAEFHSALKELKDNKASYSEKINSCAGRRISLATGTLAAPLIKEFAREFTEVVKETIDIYPIVNNFFGDKITVAGLICGCDILSQLKGKDLGDALLIPVNMLRSGESYFLDDFTVKELEEGLGAKIEIVPAGGSELLEAFLSINKENYRRQIYEQADSGYRGKA